MIRVAINGYGNLGRGVEQAITKNADMEVAVVFTRRDPATVTTQGATVAHVDDMAAWADKVDVCLNCGGSATDLIEQTPAAATLFNTTYLSTLGGQFVITPLPNHLFTRDTSAWLYGGRSVNTMALAPRRREAPGRAARAGGVGGGF